MKHPQYLWLIVPIATWAVFHYLWLIREWWKSNNGESDD